MNYSKVTALEQDYFPITSVHRDDLKAAGFDASNVPDDVMTELASKMANVS